MGGWTRHPDLDRDGCIAWMNQAGVIFTQRHDSRMAEYSMNEIEKLAMDHPDVKALKEQYEPLRLREQEKMVEFERNRIIEDYRRWIRAYGEEPCR